MKKNRFPVCLLLLVMPFSVLIGQHTSSFTIYFDTDQPSITQDAKDVLHEQLSKVSVTDIKKVKLSGHTDAEGSNQYNVELSHRRVLAVQDYFVRLGVEVEEIEMNHFGEQIPVASNASSETRQSNRRVEIEFVMKDNAMVSELPAAMITSEEVNKPKELANLRIALKDYNKKPQSFCIRNDRDTVIQGDEGTILFFKAYSFDTRDLTDFCIEIHLTEYYSTTDLLLENMHTESGDHLLETAGMIRIEAFLNHKKLQLKRGKQVDIYIPGLDASKDFQLFQGIPENTDENVNWVRSRRASRANCFNSFGSNQFCDYNFFIKRWFCYWKQKRMIKNAAKEQARRAEQISSANLAVNFESVINQLEDEINPCQMFSAFQLGWINCDRFLKEYPQRLLANIYLEMETGSHIMSSMVFKDIKSIMRGAQWEVGTVAFKNIPRDREVWVVAIKKVDGQFYLAIKEHHTRNTKIDSLPFEAVSKDELVAALDKINW